MRLNNRFNDLFSLTVYSVVVMLCLALFMWKGGWNPSVLQFSLSLIAVATFFLTGRLVLALFKNSDVIALRSAQFVVGYAVSSSVLVALATLFGLNSWDGMMLIFIISMIGNILIKLEVKKKSEWVELVIILWVCIIIFTFCGVIISSAVSVNNSGLLPIWNDYYIHGETIATFGGKYANVSNMELAGERLSFYHYAPFMLPSAIQYVSNMSGLALSTSVLLPVGLLVAGLGIYMFALEFGGNWINGVLAISAIVFLSPISKIIQSGWFDFNWLLLIAPGTGYAIGLSFVMLAYLNRWLKKGQTNNLLLVFVLLACLVLTRAHMFLLIAPVVGSLVIMKRSARLFLVLFALFSLGLAIFFAAQEIEPHVRDVWIHNSRPQEYFDFALGGAFLFGRPIIHQSNLVELVLFALFSVGGFYIFALPFASYFLIRNREFTIIDTVPYLATIVFVMLMLFAPEARNGDITEYKHRHFPLLYCIYASYFANYVLLFANNRIHESTKTILVVSLSSIFFLFYSVVCSEANPAAPDLKTISWGDQHHNTSITPGLPYIANYVNARKKVGDVAVTLINNDSRLSNTQIEFNSLTGIPAFITRATLKLDQGQCLQSIVSARQNILSELSFSNSWDDVDQTMGSNGIRWLLVSIAEYNKWDPSFQHAQLISGKIALYEATMVEPNLLDHPRCNLSVFEFQ